MKVEFKDIIELVKALIWPVVTLVIVVFLRNEVKSFIQAIITRATKISGAGMSVELAASQLQNQKLSEPTSPEEKAKALRNLEIAKSIAPKFDYWIKKYRHPEGMTHYQGLLDWLVADGGIRYVSKDYELFKALAEVLSKMDYDTIPPPSEGEFMLKVAEAEEKAEYRRSKNIS